MKKVDIINSAKINFAIAGGYSIQDVNDVFEARSREVADKQNIDKDTADTQTSGWLLGKVKANSYVQEWLNANQQTELLFATDQAAVEADMIVFFASVLDEAVIKQIAKGYTDAIIDTKERIASGAFTL